MHAASLVPPSAGGQKAGDRNLVFYEADALWHTRYLLSCVDRSLWVGDQAARPLEQRRFLEAVCETGQASNRVEKDSNTSKGVWDNHFEDVTHGVKQSQIIPTLHPQHLLE